MPTEGTTRHRTRSVNNSLPLAGALLVAAAFLSVAGWRLYRHEAADIREQKAQELAAIAELKVRQLAQWRSERLLDASFGASGPFFRRAVEQWTERGLDPTLGEDILGRLRMFLEHERYQAVFLVDGSGRVLLGSDPGAASLAVAERDTVLQAVADLEPAASNFFRSATTGRVTLSVAAPVMNAAGRADVAILLRSDPERSLFPEVQSWPTTTATGEIELVMRDGGDAVLVNSLRDLATRPMTLRIPLARTESVGVQALLAHGAGDFEGEDYRGQDVLAEARSVPGTPWVILAKENRGELLAEIRYRGRAIFAMVALSILLTAAAAAAVSNRRQQHLYRDLYAAERKQRAAREQFRTALYSIADAVITTDTSGEIRHVNRVATQLTGWTEEQAQGRPLTDVLRLLNEQTRIAVPDVVARALAADAAIEMPDHTLLVARDGVERPVAVSCALIRDDEARVTGVVLALRDQTTERTTRAALEREALQHRILFEQAKDGIVLIDAQGNVVEANRSFASMLGRTVAETLQLHPWDWDTQLATPEAYHAVRPRLRGERGTFETRVRRADGALADVEASYTLVDWEGQRVSLQVHRDITARKDADHRVQLALRAARQTRDQLQSIIEATTDCIAATDADLRFIAFNSAYAREWLALTGTEATIGLAVDDVLRDSSSVLQRALENWRRAVEGDQFTVVWETGGDPATSRCHEIMFSPIRDAGEAVVGVVHVSRDVTDRRRARRALEASEADLRRLNQELERLVDERTSELVLALDRAEAASRVKDVFVATMSHELRTPLNSIIGFTDLLLNGLAGELNAEQRTQLRIVNRSGYHLLALITDVLDLSKIEAGLLALQPGPVALNDLLVEQRATFELLARERGLTLDLDCQRDAVVVIADPKRVRQVISNLVSNAVKYTDQGGIVLRAEVCGSSARVSVQDTGIGITVADQQRLFEPFHRGEPVDGRTREGTGLGLALSRRLVVAMGGAIGVSSAPGQGSRFWFTLPLQSSSGASASPTSVGTAPG